MRGIFTLFNKTQITLSGKKQKFFSKKFEQVYKNKEVQSHVWDYKLGFTLKVNDALTIIPRTNLVKNIGYQGTHNEKKNRFHDRAVDEYYQVTSHPDFILCDINYDAYHFKHHWNNKKDMPRKLLKKLNKFIKKEF